MQRRNIFGAVALAASSYSAFAQQPAAPRTYVLVHGAWGGGWIWKRASDGLRAKGHRVFTLTRPASASAAT